jgi:xylulokinase
MRRVVPKTRQLLLGIDIGSSGVKAVLLDPDQGIIASSNFDVDQYSEYPGWSEADPLQWWNALPVLIAQLLESATASSADVKALAVSGMVPAVLVLDAKTRPLRRAILQNDARATAEIKEIRQKLGELDLLGLTGSVLSQQSVAPTALWLSRHEPAVWSSAVSIVGSYDWLAIMLGASVHVEQNWALESGLFTLELDQLDEVLEAIGVTWPLVPEVKRTGDDVGSLSASAANFTGLTEGTRIVVGGADHVLSAFGAGLVEEGDCLVKLGGAGDILAVSDRVFLDERLYLDAHPVPGKWLPNGCMATSGSLLRWEQSIFNGVALVELDDAASVSQPGALLTLPYFLGEKTPLHDPDLRGVMVGMNLATTRGDIHRSFLEAIAYGFRSNFEVFGEDGLVIRRTRVTNGGSRSRLWREILASVLQRDLISIVNHPGASYGAAVIAGIGSGVIAGWSYAGSGLEEGEIISPTPEHVELYAERYAEFVHLTAVTTPFSHQLARSLS